MTRNDLMTLARSTGIKDSVESQTSIVLYKLTWAISCKCFLRICQGRGLWTTANLVGQSEHFTTSGQLRCLWSVVRTVLQMNPPAIVSLHGLRVNVQLGHVTCSGP